MVTWACNLNLMFHQQNGTPTCLPDFTCQGVDSWVKTSYQITQKLLTMDIVADRSAYNTGMFQISNTGLFQVPLILSGALTKPGLAYPVFIWTKWSSKVLRAQLWSSAQQFPVISSDTWILFSVILGKNKRIVFGIHGKGDWLLSCFFSVVQIFVIAIR